ncbi:DUF1329 domain-containing protein [Herbaspirillum lusitanum]|uniref:DUF1329 domain-containing protein n=1 Tax=Herbaspirillum lusitanum TaxID=213312 RepID=UPI0002EDDCD8|nr:DUF1329 domain-containing protein [Herbaspirillum lusitanum]
MKLKHLCAQTAMLAAAVVSLPAGAVVSADEAAQLKTTLNPMGGEKAANKDGSIPAWSGGLTTATPGFVNGGKRADPFPGEKPVLTITSKNMDQYADKLTDGVKAMLKKYPETYRLDVYPTHRTAAAPQYVYDNIFKNATRAKLVDGGSGPQPDGAFGGIPFPIPKSGLEVMWNHILRWRGEAWHWTTNRRQIYGDGKLVLTADSRVDLQMPYYFKSGAPEKFDGIYFKIQVKNVGPAIRAGEAVTGRLNLDDSKSQSWVYLTGQRRVRLLPHACCDTPQPASAGVMNFDEQQVWTGGMQRFDWKLIGKKEIYIPYNTNRSLAPAKDEELISAHHLNPNHVRWELHRVWVVEANVAAGQRHIAPKGRYYVDEDSWNAVLADRWDAKGQLWKTSFLLPIAMPDLPGTVDLTFGFYDLLTGGGYVDNIVNEKGEQNKFVPVQPDMVFRPEAMTGDGLR